jgi:hypothetical protein
MLCGVVVIKSRLCWQSANLEDAVNESEKRDTSLDRHCQASSMAYLKRAAKSDKSEVRLPQLTPG